jgi:hypothetical protein
MKSTVENNIENAGILFFLILLLIMTIKMSNLIVYLSQYFNFGPNIVEYI